MSSASLTSGVAGRYATALFELARESGDLDALESDVTALSDAIAESSDLRAMIGSPIYRRDEQGRAMLAVAERMGLGTTLRNTVGLMARKRRLFAVPAMLTQIKALIADARGEVTAAVTAAQPLSEAQTEALSKSLRAGIGKDVKLEVTVDEKLIGGLVVRIGSRMIDTSIRSRLAQLQNIMKEAG